MFDLDQTSPNITKHDVRSPNKVCKRSNISPNMMLDQMLGEMLDRLHKPLDLEIEPSDIPNILAIRASFSHRLFSYYKRNMRISIFQLLYRGTL